MRLVCMYKTLIMEDQKKNNRKHYLFNCFVAGVQYYDALEAWAELSVGTELHLEPEPDNRYDRHAVKLMLGDKQIGYIPRSENRHMAKLLNAGWEPYDVRIQSIFNERDMAERIEICVRVIPNT